MCKERTVLLVEDDDDTRIGFTDELRSQGWDVREAASGKDALAALGSRDTFAVVLLDIFLGDMDGGTVLKKARESSLTVPPVAVVSARLGPEDLQMFLEFGVECFLKKPVGLGALPHVLDAALRGDQAALCKSIGLGEGGSAIEHRGKRVYLYGFQGDPQLRRLKDTRLIENSELRLSEEVRQREEALRDHLKECANRMSPASDAQGSNVQAAQCAAAEPVLVVARRWNSWYPSFFDVAGGAYAILGSSGSDGHPRGVLIDPGFRALEVLGRLGIPVGWLNTCIITHNHPDHVGGFFEYAAVRHVLGQHTAVYCSQSVAAMLGSYAGSLHVEPFDRTAVEIMRPYGRDRSRVRLVATPVETSHHTVGQVEGTRGVLISVETEGAGGHYNCQSSALLLGDTEYQRDRGHVNAGIFEGIRRALERRDLSAVALHIGCSQLKDAPGKHLYLTGLGDILRDIDHFRLTHELGPPAPKLLVLVSEWGLEHATLDQIQTAVQGGLPGTLADAFDNESRVRKTIEVIKESYRLQTIELLPADVGLVVGLISGKVYLKGRAVPPGRIDFQPGGKGLEYSERT